MVYIQCRVLEVIGLGLTGGTQCVVSLSKTLILCFLI